MSVGSHSWVLETSEILRHSKTELVLIPNRGNALVAPLHKYLLGNSPPESLDVTYVNEEVSLSLCAYPSKFHYPYEERSIYDTYAWMKEQKHGDCGTIVIGHFAGTSAIVGMVAYMNSIGEGGACHFNQRIYTEMVENRTLPLVDSVVINVPSFEELDQKSDFREIDSDYIQPLGTIPGSKSRFKSKFRRSRLYQQFYPFLSEPYGIPDKIRSVVDGEYYTAMKHTFKNISLNHLSKMSVRRRAVFSYLSDFQFPGEKLGPLTLDEAIFGCSSIGVDRVEFSTSVGRMAREEFGAKNKFDLFEDIEGTDKKRLKPEFLKKVNALIERLRRSSIEVPNVEFAVKDEVRPTAKLDKSKVRLFSVLDFHFNVVMRMFLMPLITFLLQNPKFSECYGQMNAGSKQWTDLKNHLDSIEGSVLDMDFEAFDTSHGSEVFEMVAILFFLLALKCGYTRSDASIVYLLVMCLRVQFIRFLNSLAIKFKGMPSGVIITLILNSLVNSLLMRMAFDVLVGIDVSLFRDYVKAATTGDDNLSKVRRDIADKYNFLSIQSLYKDWGYLVTPAMKGNQAQAFIDWDQAVFLKRRFVQWEDGFYRAPLNTDSIWKSVCFERVDSGVSPLQRLVDVLGSAQREAYLHGKEFFTDFQEKIRPSLVEMGVESNFKWLSFDSLDVEFLEGTFKTFSC